MPCTHKPIYSIIGQEEDIGDRSSLRQIQVLAPHWNSKKVMILYNPSKLAGFSLKEGSLVDPRLRAPFLPSQPRARQDALFSHASTFSIDDLSKLAHFS